MDLKYTIKSFDDVTSQSRAVLGKYKNNTIIQLNHFSMENISGESLQFIHVHFSLQLAHTSADTCPPRRLKLPKLIDLLLLLVVIHALYIIFGVLTLLFRNKARLVIKAQDKVQVGLGWNKGAKLKPWKTEAGWKGQSSY